MLIPSRGCLGGAPDGLKLETLFNARAKNTYGIPRIMSFAVSRGALRRRDILVSEEKMIKIMDLEKVEEHHDQSTLVDTVAMQLSYPDNRHHHSMMTGGCDV
jgi:hypothetical protein